MKYISIIFLSLALMSCEKEIQINVPPSQEQYVVEASVNQYFTSLNYVFLSKTLDYFNPDLSINGIKNATVYITEGSISGQDTVFNPLNRAQFVPILDSILPGVYVNPGFRGRVGSPYKLEIFLGGGKSITGRTFIPKPPQIDSFSYWNVIDKQDTNSFYHFDWFDGPEQNNYRIALWQNIDSNMFGWGVANRFFTFDDKVLNNTKRSLENISPYHPGDTLNIYFSSIGRSEYLFWDSFRKASNNGGPFATPISVVSNVTGAIGSFTGYGVTFKQIIF